MSDNAVTAVIFPRFLLDSTRRLVLRVRMRSCLIFSVGFLVLFSCEKERPQADVPEIPERPIRHDAKPSSTSGGGLRPVDRPAKLGERSDTAQRTPPTADIAPDHPNSVISPFTGVVVNVSDMEPGALIADPTSPGDEEKFFRLPDTLVIFKVPEARPVPGKAGFVFSPFNQKIIDVRDIPPGTLIVDPTYPASENKHFRLPGASEEGEPAPDVAVPPELPGG